MDKRSQVRHVGFNVSFPSSRVALISSNGLPVNRSKPLLGSKRGLAGYSFEEGVEHGDVRRELVAKLADVLGLPFEPFPDSSDSASAVCV